MHVAFILRHGARAPSHSALKPFKETPVASCWDANEIENLTDFGKKCSFRVGEAFAIHETFHAIKNKPVRKVRWQSSPSIRAKESGEKFVHGFIEKLSQADGNDSDLFAITKDLTEPYSPVGQDLDAIFRPWLHNQDYLSQNVEMKGGDIFQKKAASEKEFLMELSKIVSPSCEKSLVKMLSLTTYFVEIIECEQNDAKQRRALCNALSEKQTEKVCELGRWCWNQRFFNMEISPTLGKPLFDVIFENSNETDLAYYSGHDYTILALLASLGIKQYPENVLGYSSYLILLIDTTEKENGKPKVKKIILNPKPFEHFGSAVAVHNEICLLDHS
mmetsp:Transcript_8961/g.11676  ORF Transcript_8961/g.11676 Transcript_8961/m.11676 type:complete len:332 (+) Transcript_8961:88-1083(+)